MQSHVDKGEVVVTYTDGTSARLALRNPETWWPIEQDYFIDDYQFPYQGVLPPRVDLKTGNIRLLDPVPFKGQGRDVPGGAATVLEIALDPPKDLKSLTVRTLSNDPWASTRTCSIAGRWILPGRGGACSTRKGKAM